ncbi:MAG: winged helix-turn-helix domain-containing protein [Nitrososphaerales archaeon]
MNYPFKNIEKIELAKVPNYGVALKHLKRKKIVAELAKKGGVGKFSELERATGFKANVLVHHLNVLEKDGVIERVVEGTYRLTYKTPLCFIYQSKEIRDKVAYIGLLGRRDGKKAPEPQVAIELLEKEGYRPKLIYVTTSTDAFEEWEKLKLPYQWIICYENEIVDIDAIKRKVRPQLESLLTEYLVILDCTSATKPATIAYYELANQYLIPLIYIYEPIKSLKWLISKEALLRIIGMS